jgi:hypothetical protein|tara:strand:- start:1350 stop:1631 length:282 start_codon:yes stop_codon:yes gene_type:complete
MKLKYKLNPQDYFKFRKLNHQAPHLAVIDLPLKYNIQNAIETWIDSNLKNRYFIGKAIGLTKNNSIDQVLRVGFEDPKELSFFVLACPLLKYK